MSPIVNPFIFCILVLFGIEAGVYSYQTTITIDRANQLATFHHIGLQSHSEEVDTARKALAQAEEMVGFHDYFEGLELISIKKLSSTTTDYEVKLKYDNEKRLHHYFGIDLSTGTVMVYPGEIVKVGDQLIKLDKDEPTAKHAKFENSTTVLVFTRKEHELFEGCVDL